MTAQPSLDIFAAARRFGHRPALILDEKTLSFSDLAGLVGPVVSSLRAMIGDSDCSRIGIQAGNSQNTIVTLLALMSARIPFVPFHPKLTASETGSLLQLCGSPQLLRDADLCALCSARGEKGSVEPSGHGDRTSTAAILFTSGVSGTPKGAVLSHGAFIASAKASEANLGWCDGDRWLLCLPLCHVGGLSILTRSLLSGYPVVLSPSSEPLDILHASKTHAATLLSVVPTVMNRLLATDSKNQLAAFRAILVGGAAAPREMIEECRIRQVRPLLTYGLTEACSQVASERPGDVFSGLRGCGRPLPGIDLQVLNTEGVRVERGQSGRIRIRGPVLMDGYLNHPKLDADRGFDSGDIGWMDEQGLLHICGRADDTIISGGENVYPLEVEAALRGFAGVQSCVVFGVPDKEWGQAVAVAVVPDDVVLFSEAAFCDYVRAHLAPFRRPKYLTVWRDFPTLPGGKIDRLMVTAESAGRLCPIRSGGLSE